MFELFVGLAAFIITVIVVTVIQARQIENKPAPRQPRPTPYTGPRYSAHGREIKNDDARRVI